MSDRVTVVNTRHISVWYNASDENDPPAHVIRIAHGRDVYTVGISGEEWASFVAQIKKEQ